MVWLCLLPAEFSEIDRFYYKIYCPSCREYDLDRPLYGKCFADKMAGKDRGD